MTNPPKEALTDRVLCFVLHGTTSQYKIRCSYYFTKQLNGRDLFTWTKEVIAAVETCGFIIVRIDSYSANVTMFKLMAIGTLNTVVRHPHDTSLFIFLSFDLCRVLRNARNQFFDRGITDGTDVISVFVKNYESIKSARL
ncbi:hypothetical protein HPB50_013017 [Hyalomma asiaticum]|uniref:Uncharacterized protein n=1 Tax=Hyalomma asiaticum TaxID=266040 RepID=A0ACB7T7R2_HYAAI|nr:hypothetical protein HPB50_013017 [Hyalomma asiaticum]